MSAYASIWRVPAQGGRTNPGLCESAPDPAGDPMSFRLVNGSETILELKLTGKGSDGMSENLFPFEALRGRHDGGCETDKYPAFEIYELLEDVGITP